MARLGVYGGTFDPIHFGHLAVARGVCAAFRLRRVLFVPARQSPLRRAPAASARDRLAMVRRAVADTPEFEASAVDVERPGPSFMIDTLRLLAQAHPRAALFVIVGADALAEMPAWRQAGEILDAAQVIAVARPGAAARLPPDLAALHPRAAQRVHAHRMPPMDIAASHVRRLRARGRPIDAYVSVQVARYVEARGLYVRAAAARGMGGADARASI